MLVCARAALQLFGSEWLPQGWSRRDIYFHTQGHLGHDLDFARPHIVTNNASTSTARPGTAKKKSIHPNPLLCELGILFIEIASGKSLDSVGLDQVTSLLAYDLLKPHIGGAMQRAIELCLYPFHSGIDILGRPIDFADAAARNRLDKEIVELLEGEVKYAKDCDDTEEDIEAIIRAAMTSSGFRESRLSDLVPAQTWTGNTETAAAAVRSQNAANTIFATIAALAPLKYELFDHVMISEDPR
jgi:hypothetical protein